MIILIIKMKFVTLFVLSLLFTNVIGSITDSPKHENTYEFMIYVKFLLYHELNELFQLHIN